MIRRASIKDLNALMALENESFSESERRDRATIRYGITSPSIVSLVLTRYGKVQGVIELHSRSNSSKVYIANLSVSVAGRERGIASALLRRALYFTKRAGKQVVSLHVSSLNTGARRLYQKLGFVIDQHLKDYYDEGVDAKKLSIQLY